MNPQFSLRARAMLKKAESKARVSEDTSDRRSGTQQGPYVNDGKLPRTRNKDGTWRKKRSGAKDK